MDKGENQKIRYIEYNGFKYLTEIDDKNEAVNFKLEHNKEEPEHLYKYYSLNSNSIDSLINHYLFSAHPMLLNDKYDCAGELIDYSSVNLPTFQYHLAEDLNILPVDRIKQYYNSDQRWMLERILSDLNQLRLYGKIGIISMTEEYENQSMWGYYAQNKGFAIKFDTKVIKPKFWGPFPINYVESLPKIEFTKYDFSLCIFFQTNIKHKQWEKENEWRFLSYTQNGYFQPYYHKDYESRKFYYNPAAIKEIILGYDIFSPNEINYKERTPNYDVVNLNNKKSKDNKKLKRRLLNYIVRYNIPCSQIIRNRNEYKLEAAQIKIEKLTTNRFKIHNAFKF